MVDTPFLIIVMIGSFSLGCLVFGSILNSMEPRIRDLFLKGFVDGANPVFWWNVLRGKHDN